MLLIISHLIDTTTKESVVEKWSFKRQSLFLSTVYYIIKNVKNNGNVVDKIRKCGIVTVNTKQ